MAVQTKSLADPRNSDDGTRILVARYRPRWVRSGEETWDEWISALGPSRELLRAFRADEIMWEEFILTYRQEMQAQGLAIRKLRERAVAGERITLLCHCRDEQHCHRRILQEIICDGV